MFQRQKVAVASIGGWDKCKGPFTASQAKHYGVDEWECHDNCYLRVDQNGSKSHYILLRVFIYELKER